MTDRTTNRARAVTWAAFTLGVAASIAANVAHARPQWGPRLAGAFAPVALLAVIEMLARVPWPAGGRWRAGKWLGAAVVAGVAAVTSYRHMAGLLVAYGEDELTASILPLAVDGLMVVASAALLAMGRGRPALAPVPAAAAAMSADISPAIPAATTSAPADKTVDTSAPVTTPVTSVDSTANVATPRTTARTTPRTTARTTGRPSTADTVAKLAAKMPDATADKIAVKAGVSERTVRRHLAAMATDRTPDTKPVNGHRVLAAG